MLDRKQIPAILLFELNMGRKIAEATCTFSSAFGPGIGNERTVQQWFRKICKGDKSLENEEHSGQPSGMTMTKWEPPSKLILLQLCRKLLKNSTVHSTAVWHFKQIGKVKKFEKWLPHELTESQRDCCFEVSSTFILCSNNNEPFLNWIVTCNEK